MQRVSIVSLFIVGFNSGGRRLEDRRNVSIRCFGTRAISANQIALGLDEVMRSPLLGLLGRQRTMQEAQVFCYFSIL